MSKTELAPTYYHIEHLTLPAKLKSCNTASKIKLSLLTFISKIRIMIIVFLRNKSNIIQLEIKMTKVNQNLN